MAHRAPELAAQGAVFKEIPEVRATVSVTTSSAVESLAPYVGKWVWLRAITADITLMRAASVTAGSGYVLQTTAGHVDFYIDPDGVLTLAHRCASGTATLEILY